jgi:hypothetical protein
VPAAATLKEAVWPAVTLWLAGCVVIEGLAPDVLNEWPPLRALLLADAVDRTW